MSARRCQVTPAPLENGNVRHSVAEQVASPEASAQPEPQPAEQLELSWGPELYAGWLRSRAQWRNQWSRRWFIARPGCVEYYTSPEETEAPRAHIPLEGCKLTAVSRTAISLAPSLNGRATPSPVAYLSQFEIVCPSPYSAGFVYRCRRRGGRTALSCWCAARRPRCVVTPAMLPQHGTDLVRRRGSRGYTAATFLIASRRPRRALGWLQWSGRPKAACLPESCAESAGC